jgi:DNA mismatch endonuclease Vsr
VSALAKPWPDVPENRRNVMKANRSKHTRPEIVVRKMLHAMGYRFRLHRKDLPGTPDIVFPSRKVVIQVHGCFWHQHPGCRDARIPATRRQYWGPKLAKNACRDAAAETKLREMGWEVMVIWGCEVANLQAVSARCVAILG